METDRNREDRAWMLRYWTDYIKSHSDREWSEKQRVLIDALIPDR